MEKRWMEKKSEREGANRINEKLEREKGWDRGNISKASWKLASHDANTFIIPCYFHHFAGTRDINNAFGIVGPNGEERKRKIIFFLKTSFSTYENFLRRLRGSFEWAIKGGGGLDPPPPTPCLLITRKASPGSHRTGYWKRKQGRGSSIFL